jgi:oligopeptide/dipeptide ABC transporter ATP-binding protein
MDDILLEVRGARKYFPRSRGTFLSKPGGDVKAVDGVDFYIAKGEAFGLVGESGSGKTTVGKLILLLEKLTSGSILFQGKDISNFSMAELLNYRASVHVMFQDPYGSLDPRMRVGQIVGEPIKENAKLSKQAINAMVGEALREVGLDPDSAYLYPHQFSGGQRQRIALARALILKPLLIVLDEPVSALDVSIRAQIMNLLMDLHNTHGLAYLLIAHDLSVVKHMCNRIGVMYVGKLVECANSKEIYRHPLHPYTQALFSAILAPNPNSRKKVITLPGEVASPINPPLGCRFHPRCTRAMPLCSKIEPSMEEVASGHFVACHLLGRSDGSG